MTRTARTVVLAISALSLTGCGTICNLASKDPQVYGGPAKDFEVVQYFHGCGGIGGAVVLVSDMCISLVGDTLTLPILLYRRERLSAREEQVYYLTVGEDNPVRLDSPTTAPAAVDEFRPIIGNQENATSQDSKDDFGKPRARRSDGSHPSPHDPLLWDPSQWEGIGGP
jgi:uncharacterized protein YceK